MASDELRCVFEKEALDSDGVFEYTYEGCWPDEDDLGVYELSPETKSRMVEVPREELERMQKLTDIKLMAEYEARKKRRSE